MSQEYEFTHASHSGEGKGLSGLVSKIKNNPAILMVAGVFLVIGFAIMNRGSSSSSVETSSSSPTDTTGIENASTDSAISTAISNNNDNLMSQFAQITTNLEQRSDTQIKALTDELAASHQENLTLSDTVSKALSQVQQYEQQSQKVIEEMSNTYAKQIEKVSTEVQEYTTRPVTQSQPSTPVNNSTPSNSIGTGSSSNSNPSVPQGNPYNANPSTGKYEYGGVDYSGYTGAADQVGSKEEAAYWNNFINSSK